MKLLEFVQEGVFDKVKAKPAVKMRLKDLTVGNVRVLSDEAFREYQEYWLPRRDRIWKSMNEIRAKTEKIRNIYSNDFTKTAGRKGFVQDPHNEYGSTWVRSGSEGERLIDQLEGEYTLYNEKYEMYSNLSIIFRKEQKHREQVKKKEGRVQAADDWPTYQEQHPTNTPSTIPPKVSRAAGLKPSLANPYFGRSGCKMDKDKQYAGHPAHYPYWSNDWKRRVMAFEELLIRNGKQGFEMMYASTFFNSGNRFNFMIIGAGGNFLWRKYDPCPAAGQNDIFLNGKKGKASTLESMNSQNPTVADVLIQQL